MSRPVVSVAVNASQKGVIVWDFVRRYFDSSPLQLEFNLYSTTERMVEALKRGEVDIAWHGPMGWVQTVRATDGRCQGIGMRDGDVDYKSYLLTTPGSDIKDLGDLTGKRVHVGYDEAIDNTIMPLFYLRRAEVPLSDLKVVRPLGHRNRELDYSGEAAGVAAVREGRADATFVGYKYWDTVLAKQDDGGSSLDIAWESPARGHCVFATMDTASTDLVGTFTEHLFKMDYEDSESRHVMDLEWLKAWVPAKMAYEDLMAATEG